MNESLLQIPAEITKVTTMAHRSVRIVADSCENRSEEQMAKIMWNHGKAGYWCFLAETPIDPLDIVSLPQAEEDRSKKTKSQILRWRLEELAKVKGRKTREEIEAFYNTHMDRITDHVVKQTEPEINEM